MIWFNWIAPSLRRKGYGYKSGAAAGGVVAVIKSNITEGLQALGVEGNSPL